MSGLPNIDYTSRDFAGFRESLLAYASERTPEWRGARTGDPNDFGVLLVEAFAYEGDVLSYYTDRLANEAFLSTATQRQSVLAHAALLDYTPRSATAATVPLTFTVTTTTRAVTIPAGFKVSTAPPEGGDEPEGAEEPLTFETTRPLVFPASTTGQPLRTSLTVTAIEGQTIEDEVAPVLCGDPNHRYTLASSPAIIDSVQVRIVERPGDKGTVWQRVRTLLDADREDNAYTLTLDANDAVTIELGDGINGRIPPRGSVMHVRYRTGGGSDGNVDEDLIIHIDDPGDIEYDKPGEEEGGGDAPGDSAPAPTELVVTNQVPARGGTDSETLASIRENAPRARRTNGRAVSLLDYEVLARQVPGTQIAKAKAVSSVYTNITLYLAPPGGAQPDQRTLNAVIDYLQPRKMSGVTVVAATPTYVPIDLSMVLLVDSRYQQSSVRTAVSNMLQRLLGFESVNFGERVTLSSVYTTATLVRGVVNVVITKMARAGSDLNTVADVFLKPNELPIAGVLDLQVTGGIVGGSAQAGPGALDAADSAEPPVATLAPTFTELRCDPSSTHVELVWTPGDATTHWEVEVEYQSATQEVVATTVAGPFTEPPAVFDLPHIGRGRAVQMSVRTRAYNGELGPANSHWTTVPYTCEP